MLVMLRSKVSTSFEDTTGYFPHWNSAVQAVSVTSGERDPGST
jgi:hypothetical protein